eukprot:1158208-Pelagomonas_calceolata.AAC.47
MELTSNTYTREAGPVGSKKEFTLVFSCLCQSAKGNDWGGSKRDPVNGYTQSLLTNDSGTELTSRSARIAPQGC